MKHKPCFVCGTRVQTTPIPLRRPRHWWERYPPKESLWVCGNTEHVLRAMETALLTRTTHTGEPHHLDPDLSALLAAPTCRCGAVLFDD